LEQEARMLAAAESRDAELPERFVAPMVPVERLRLEAPDRHVLAAASADLEGGEDLGWHDVEPLLGRPSALAGLLGQAEHETVVLASEQRERLLTLLGEAGVG